MPLRSRKQNTPFRCLWLSYVGLDVACISVIRRRLFVAEKWLRHGGTDVSTTKDEKRFAAPRAAWVPNDIRRNSGMCTRGAFPNLRVTVGRAANSSRNARRRCWLCCVKAESDIGLDGC